MEDFKRPGTILSLANTAYLIGGTILIYRKMNEFDTKINDFSSLVNNTIKVAGDCKSYGTQIEAVKNAVQASTRELDDLRHENKYLREELEECDSRLRTIIRTLRENGIDVSRDERPRHRDYSPHQDYSHRRRDDPPPRYRDDYRRRDEPSPRRRDYSPNKRSDKISVSDLGF
jgi:hypothetical protein